jgi:hypothetical protein
MRTDSAFLPSAIQLINQFCGICLTPVTEAEAGVPTDIYYGNDQGCPCKLRIPMVDAYSPTDVPLPSTRTTEAGEHDPFPFDLFAAVRFWLADEGNERCAESAFDNHGRLMVKHSIQSSLNVVDLPVINWYLLMFREWLTTRLKIRCHTLLPTGKKCAIVLSHDVDNAINPGDPFHHLGLAGLALRNRKVRTAMLLLCNAFLRAGYGFVRPNERRWLFSEIIKAEARHGFRSTFFFASMSKAEGHELDVSYDVARSNFRCLLKEVAECGWEIGLQVSYCAGDNAQSMAAERVKLESIVKREVRGARHHYWHLSRPFWATLDRHAQAGIKYDCSLGFNDAPGFRLGIAYPFRPWNPVAENSIKTLQIPTFMMDGSLFEYGRLTANGALERMASLLNILKKYEGIAALDWHEYTSFPGSREFGEWGQTYLTLLEMLSADREIAVFTGAEVYGQWDIATKQSTASN